METKAPAKKNNPTIIILLVVIIILLLMAVLAVFLLRGSGGGAGTAQSVTADDGGVPKLGYASEGVTAVEDANALQAAVDEMYEKAKEGQMALEYKNDAVSSDGKTFTCYIANAMANNYDMYIDIYADLEFTDQLFLSGLIRPGEAFESIELTHELEPGTHTVYCAFTQVEEDMQTIHAQMVVTLLFHVRE